GKIVHTIRMVSPLSLTKRVFIVVPLWQGQNRPTVSCEDDGSGSSLRYSVSGRGRDEALACEQLGDLGQSGVDERDDDIGGAEVVSGDRTAMGRDIVLERAECGPHGFLVAGVDGRSEEHTSELQSRFDLVCRLLLEKKV